MNKPFALVADLGATHSRIAMIARQGDSFSSVEVFKSATYASPLEVFKDYSARYQLSAIKELAIAIAAPVTGDLISFTNINWTLSVTALKETFSLSRIQVINDVEALAYAVPFLSEEHLLKIGRGTIKQAAPKFIIAPGTGVGTATLIKHQAQYLALPSEGGHTLFSPQDTVELALLEQAFETLKVPVMIEHFLSGKHGVDRLISLMRTAYEPSFPLIPAETLIDLAINKQDPFAIRILDQYCAMLGNVAGNFALTTGALGGVYIGGGIIPRFLDFFKQSSFRNAFENKPSIHNYISKIPTFVITEPFPALKGLAFLLN